MNKFATIYLVMCLGMLFIVLTHHTKHFTDARTNPIVHSVTEDNNRCVYYDFYDGTSYHVLLDCNKPTTTVTCDITDKDCTFGTETELKVLQ